jgi:replication factor A1
MGGGLEVDLSHGAVEAMWRSPGSSTLRPVMQVADARHVPDGSGLSPAREQRYCIDLSDGVHSQPGTLAVSLNRLVSDGALRRGSVVRVLDFVCDYRRR